MNLSTRQMRAFLQVARIDNFTRAAEQAHITQAGLSILIREMEKQLGCRLFDRTTRMVSLTPAGRREAHHARGAVEQAAAELLLHLADQDAQAGLGDVRLLGRAREVVDARHLQEGAHLARAQVHKDS